MFTVPVDVVAEFRGRKQSREFQRDGKTFNSSEVLYFELDNPLSGEPMHLRVRVNQLERDQVAFEGIERGDQVRIVGVVRAAEQGDEYGSQLIVGRFAQPGSPAAPQANGAAKAGAKVPTPAGA
ncbi:hypothetical protein PAI11_00610 [Patulibacter medicamentivorans]|uniref:Uncharacterized protein n=1 Tax=Patulibacter medicamentivorans TaxID=1097667 RepID=H0DZV6_9ACTN|nr:hypothetical protein [Patulibacter medicamentivorans]EHN13060.1 hypothetical protein PAI11_00610 [Patulibacter medicamentivorans]